MKQAKKAKKARPSILAAFAILGLIACERAPVANASNGLESAPEPIVYTSGENPDLPSFFELEAFESYGSVGDGELIALIEAGQIKPGLTALHMAQLAAARQAIIGAGGAYAEALADGRYLNDPDSHWEVHALTDARTDTAIDAILWSEQDDGSFSVMFEPGTTKILYVYYEN